MISFFCFVRLPTLLAKWWRRCSPANNETEPAPRRKPSFVIYRLDALGDVILTTPLLRELKRTFPDSSFTLVVQEPYRSLFTTNPHVDRLLTLPAVSLRYVPRKIKRLVAALSFWRTHLRGRHFDVALSPRWDLDEHLATFLCVITNAATRVGYTSGTSTAKQRLNRGFDDVFDLCLPAGPAQHEVLRNLAIVKTLGGVVMDTSLDIWLTDRDRRHAAHILADVRPGEVLVALGIGAQAASRRWPLERYAQVIMKLHRELDVRAVIVCSGDERLEATTLAEMLDAKSIIVSGEHLRETCAVLARCDLFIGNDSGAAHLAAAAGCKTIVVSRHPLSGDANHPNSPVRFAPWSPGPGKNPGRNKDNRVLQPGLGLNQCVQGCVASVAHCIRAVPFEQVASAALAMLQQPRVQAGELRSSEFLIPVAANVPAYMREEYAARV